VVGNPELSTLMDLEERQIADALAEG